MQRSRGWTEKDTTDWAICYNNIVQIKFIFLRKAASAATRPEKYRLSALRMSGKGTNTKAKSGLFG